MTEKSPAPADIYWLIANVVGIIAFLLLGSALWVSPSEEGTPGGPGDGFYFFFLLVPILLSFSVVNLIALIVATRRAIRLRTFIPVLLALSVLLAWAAAVSFDRYKSLRGSQSTAFLSPPSRADGVLASQPNPSLQATACGGA